jgi:hypothetical protein
MTYAEIVAFLQEYRERSFLSLNENNQESSVRNSYDANQVAIAIRENDKE